MVKESKTSVVENLLAAASFTEGRSAHPSDKDPMIVSFLSFKNVLEI